MPTRNWTAEGLLANVRRGGSRIADDGGLGLGRRLARQRQNPVTPEVLQIERQGIDTSVPGVRQILIPGLRLSSEKNRRDHWAVKARRTKEQRATVFYTLCDTGWHRPGLPCTITLTRIAPQGLDDDNTVHSLSAVQDGVADWLCGIYGRGQDRLAGLYWKYAEEHSQAGGYAVRISIHERQAEGDGHA